MSYDVNNSLPANMQAGPNYLTTGQGGEVGNAITEGVGFYGTAPIAQQAGSAQAAVTVSTITTAATTTTPFGFATSTQANNLSATVAANTTLLNEVRQSLVDLGLIKGAA